MKPITLILALLATLILLSWISSEKNCVSKRIIGKYHCNDGRDITITDDKENYKIKLENFGISSGDYNATCDNGQLKVELPFLGKTVFNYDSTYTYVKFLNKTFNRQY